MQLFIHPMRRIPVKVTMKNPKTGELKEVKIGWSWTLFLFSGFFGLPLFLRKLYVWGGVFLALWILSFALVGFTDGDAPADWILTFIFFGLEIFVAIKGNELTAKNYLELGWEFTEPDSDTVRMAKGKWGLK